MHIYKAGTDMRIQLFYIKPDKYLKIILVLISNLKIPIDIIHINQSSLDSSIFFMSRRRLKFWQVLT